MAEAHTDSIGDACIRQWSLVFSSYASKRMRVYISSVKPQYTPLTKFLQCTLYKSNNLYTLMPVDSRKEGAISSYPSKREATFLPDLKMVPLENFKGSAA